MTAESQKNIYSTKDHNNSIYVRNTDCWASDLDLTCLSPWNSAGQEVMGGVLVSPRHVIFCRHSSHYPPAGSTIRFVNQNNQVVEATIISETDIGWDVRETSSWDFTIAYLDRDVTASGISVAKILPDNYNQYFEPWSYGSEPILNNKKPIPFELPTLFVDPEDKALVMELEVIKSVIFLYSETSADWVIEAGLSPLFSALKSQDNTRLAFFENVVGGDSGSGSFLIINDTLVLIGVSTSGGEGTSGPALIAEAKDRINTAMNALAAAQGNFTNYSLTSIDLN